MKKNVFILLMLLTSFSCDINNTNNLELNDLFDATLFSNGYKGITFTGHDGNIFKSDPSDWCLPIDYTIESFGPAYPNPVQFGQDFYIRFMIPRTMKVKIYISSFNNVRTTVFDDEALMGYYELKLNTRDFSKGVYRAFFETKSKTCFGDIWIK